MAEVARICVMGIYCEVKKGEVDKCAFCFSDNEMPMSEPALWDSGQMPMILGRKRMTDSFF